MATVEELVFRLSATSEALRRELKRSEQATQQSTAAINNQLAKIDGQVSGIGGRLAGLTNSFGGLRNALGAIGVTYAIKELGQAILQAGLNFDRLKTQLTFATGSEGAALSKYDDLLKLSNNLGLSFDATAQSFAKFASATQGTALAGAQTEKIFQSVAEAATAMQLSTDQTEGVFLALTQMISKGTVQAEELRGQLGERLPKAFQLAAQALGTTTAGLNKMLQNGQVIADDFLPKFADELHKTYGEAAVNSSESATAAVARLGTAWDQLLTTLSSSRATAAVTNFLADFVNGVTAGTRALESFFGVIDERSLNQLTNTINDLYKSRSDLINQKGSLSDGQLGGPQEQALLQQLDEIDSRLSDLIVKRSKLMADINKPQQQNPNGNNGNGDGGAEAKKLADRLADLNFQYDQLGRSDREQAIANAVKGFENTPAAAKMRELGAAIYDATEAQKAFTQAEQEADKAQSEMLSKAKQVTEANRTPVEAYTAAVRELNEVLASGEISQDTFNRAVDQAGKTAFPNALNAVDDATGGTQKYKDTLDELAQALQAGVIDIDQYNKAVSGLEDEANGVVSASKLLKDASHDAGTAISTSFEDAIIQGKGLNDVMQGLLQTLAQIALRAAVTKPLEGLVGGLFDFGGSALGSLFGPATNAAGFRATGAGPGASGAQSTGSGIFGFLSGITSLFFADGGKVSGPGGPRSDSILAALSNGEFVVNAAAAKKYGPLLNAINSGQFPRFADGGPVGGAYIPPMVSDGGPGRGSGITLNNSFTLNAQGGKQEENADLVQQFSKKIVPQMQAIIRAELVTQQRSGGILNRGYSK